MSFGSDGFLNEKIEAFLRRKGVVRCSTMAQDILLIIDKANKEREPMYTIEKVMNGFRWRIVYEKGLKREHIDFFHEDLGIRKEEHLGNYVVNTGFSYSIEHIFYRKDQIEDPSASIVIETAGVVPVVYVAAEVPSELPVWGEILMRGPFALGPLHCFNMKFFRFKNNAEIVLTGTYLQIK